MFETLSFLNTKRILIIPLVLVCNEDGSGYRICNACIKALNLQQQNTRNMSGDRYIIGDQNAPYFVTFTVVDWVDVFTRTVYKNIIVDNANFCIKNKGLDIIAWCLMTNHFHAIMQAREGYELSAIIRDYKKHMSKLLISAIQSEPESRREWILHRFEWAAKHDKRITNYQFWQESNHAIHLDPLFPERFRQRINYIHENPIRAGIVLEAKDYLYSSAIDYAGEKGLIDIVPIQ